MSTKDPPYLPDELADIILDNVSRKETLKCCALVCRSWACLSQTRLFRCVVLDIIVDQPADTSSSPCHRLREIFEQSPHLMNHVRKVTIICHESESHLQVNPPAGDPGQSMQQQIVAALLPQLRHLVDIALEIRTLFSGVPAPFNVDPALMDAFHDAISLPHVQHVTLRGLWRFSTLAQFTSLMGHTLTPLTSLRLAQVSCLDELGPISPTVPLNRRGPPLFIQSIAIIDMDYINHLVKWFSSMTRPISIKTLILDNSFDPTPLLRVLSDVEELRLNGFTEACTLDLSPFIRLSKLSISLCSSTLSFIRSIRSGNYFTYLELCHEDTSPSTRMVVLPQPAELGSIEELDRCLSSEHFPRLQKVILTLPYASSDTSEIVQSMPCLLRRNILHIRLRQAPYPAKYIIMSPSRFIDIARSSSQDFDTTSITMY